jgi:hypothetical protein
MLQNKNILGLKQISTGAILRRPTADNGRSAVLPKPWGYALYLGHSRAGATAARSLLKSWTFRSTTSGQAPRALAVEQTG